MAVLDSLEDVIRLGLLCTCLDGAYSVGINVLS